MPHEALSPGKVAEVLNCSLKTVYRNIESGELPAFRLGDKGHLRVTVVDLLAFRKRNRRKVKRREP